MTADEALAMLADDLEFEAMLLAVAKLHDAGDEMPSGHLYVALMQPPLALDHTAYRRMLAIGEDMGLWTLASSHLLRLTDFGRDTAEKIRQLLEEL